LALCGFSLDSRLHICLSFVKITALFFLFIFSTTLWACPMCGGSDQTDNANITIIILATFIALIYIPYYLIYRLIKKNKDFNNKSP
jgi:hypothetical protein